MSQTSPFAPPPSEPETAEFTEEEVIAKPADPIPHPTPEEASPQGDDLGIGNFITPEDIKAGKTTLSPEQMEQLKLKMKTDFSSSTDFLTREKWNQRHYDAKQKMDNCTHREFIESADIKRQTEIYLKGRYVKRIEGTEEYTDA